MNHRRGSPSLKSSVASSSNSEVCQWLSIVHAESTKSRIWKGKMEYLSVSCSVKRFLTSQFHCGNCTTLTRRRWKARRDSGIFLAPFRTVLRGSKCQTLSFPLHFDVSVKWTVTSREQSVSYRRIVVKNKVSFRNDCKRTLRRPISRACRSRHECRRSSNGFCSACCLP